MPNAESVPAIDFLKFTQEMFASPGFVAVISVSLTLLSTIFVDWVKSSREKKKEKVKREMALRRDVYIPLACAYAEAQDLFSSFFELDKENYDLKLSPVSRNAFAATELIADESVLKTVNDATEQFAKGILRLSKVRQIIVRHEVDISQIDKMIEKLVKERDGYTKLIDQQIAAGILTEEVNNSVGKLISEVDAEMRPLYVEKSVEQKKVFSVQQKLQHLVVKEISDLNAMTGPALIALREHLEIPTNHEAFLMHHRASEQMCNEDIPKFIDDLWSGSLDDTEDVGGT